MDDAIILSVRGKRYGGVVGAALSFSLDVTPSFEIEYADRWQHDAEPWPLAEGDDAAISIGADTVLTGSIDETSAEYDAKTPSMRLTVRGRAAPGVLEDCATDARQWQRASIGQIASDIARPFGVSVAVADAGAEVLALFATQAAERAMDALERLAATAGLSPAVRADGSLSLERPADGAAGTRAAVVRRTDVMRAERRSSARERYSVYRAVQVARGGVNVLEVRDPAVRAERQTVIYPSREVSQDALVRARNRAAAQAETLSYDLAGYRSRDGRLWAPGRMVDVDDDRARIKAQLLITEVRMRYEPLGVGAMTTLVMRRPEPYQVRRDLSGADPHRVVSDARAGVVVVRASTRPGR